MKIYLDTYSIYRPLDIKNQTRILLEAEAVLGIIMLCDLKEIELVSSFVLEFEINNNLLPIRREHGRQVLALASFTVPLTESIEQRARVLCQFGLQPLDALHLASAEEANAHYLCTCDDNFLKKSSILNSRVAVVSPIDCLKEIAS